jgi:hypothetical protein
LVVALQDDLDGVSILTSPTTVPVAENLVEELRGRTATNPTPDLTPAAAREPGAPAEGRGLLILGGALLVIGGLVGLMILSRDRE